MVGMRVGEARRVAVAGQGFGGRRRGVAVVERLGVVQIDSVNVLARAHYLPVFARVGAYDRGVLDAAAWRTHRLFEYWGHMASLLPVGSQPLFRWRMARAREGVGTWGHVARFAREKRRYLARVLREIRDRGPLAASELSSAEASKGGWWVWSEAKHAVEALFWQGRLCVATRRAGFERVYDLPERVLPAEVHAAPTPREADAHRELVRIAARALGVATEDDLADWFRLSRKETRPRVAELVEEGELEPVAVEGWDRPAWRHRDARARRFEGCALLAPFDPLVWHRPRALRLFDFHYRIGIYTPAAARTHGYYVLPVLLGDELVARVDLKADRAARVLRVQSAWLEEGRRAGAVAEPVRAELRRMADWLGLEDVVVARRGTLAAALR
ncbi:MAG: YcaQ family DNA glycosylase [Labilithrix sp.]|nr:YcaQ family DNA glycosylase [Labilithrix sp.]MCW5811130.1 YcaQ family DNA glycosylase [Labilithrix sp.]